MDSKFSIQEKQYEFPYHYVPRFDADGTPQVIYPVDWGLEYLLYNRHIAEIVTSKSPESVLDIGCGDGRFLSYLPDAIKRRVGCDMSKPAIKLAKAMNGDAIEYLAADSAEVEGQFDVVTTIQVLEHIPDDSVDHFLDAAAARTKPGGTLIINVPSVFMKLSPKHYRHYTTDLLQEQFDPQSRGFETVDLYYLLKPRSLAYKLQRRLIGNKVATIDAPFIRKFAWKTMWENRVQKERGLHVVGVYRKKPSVA